MALNIFILTIFYRKIGNVKFDYGLNIILCSPETYVLGLPKISSALIFNPFYEKRRDEKRIFQAQNQGAYKHSMQKDTSRPIWL